MAQKPIFEVLVLLGRPAAGKSEIRSHLQHTELSERIERYHIGEMDVIDDFPMLWTWFEEDTILSKQFGKPRLHTDEESYFKYHYQWDLLIERIGLEYQKKIRDEPDYHQHKTTIVEFSRGCEHGGYTQAFRHISDEILERAGIVYIQVSYQESLRKNRLRFNPERPDSILEHSLPDEKMERLYRDDDWNGLSGVDGEYLTVRDVKIPYVVLENEDDVTTPGGEELSRRLESTLGRLWHIANGDRSAGDED